MNLEAFAEAFAKRGLVPAIHIHEGTQIHDNQIDKFYLNEEEQKDNAPQDERITDQLYYELGADLNKYHDVVAALGMCRRPCELKKYLRPILKDRDGRVPARFVTAATAELFIPHLTKYKGKLTPQCLIRHL